MYSNEDVNLHPKLYLSITLGGSEKVLPRSQVGHLGYLSSERGLDLNYTCLNSCSLKLVPYLQLYMDKNDHIKIFILKI